MVGVTNGLFFGGTEVIEPTEHQNAPVAAIGHLASRGISGSQKLTSTSGRDELILNGDQGATYIADDSDADDDVPYENPQTGERSLKRAGSPSINGQQPSKKPYTSGGRAAVPKRIVADYDSDDGRIISLKQQCYSDEYVAQKLIQEGRIRYVPKTVGSRWLRLRKALEQAEGEKLDDELSDWHVGEDELLKTSFDAIENKFEREMQKVIERKWKEISANLADRLQRKKYTAKACRERFSQVQEGNALLPIEIDPDQEGRKQMRENRIAAAKRRRAEEATKAQRAEEERKHRLEEKKAEMAEKERERILKAHERDAIKAEEERIKKEKAADREARRVAKKAAAERAKAQAKWDRTKRNTDAKLFAGMTGRRMRGAPRPRRAAGPRRSSGSAARRGGRRSRDDFVNQSEDEEDAPVLSDEDEAEISEDGGDSDSETVPLDSSSSLNASSPMNGSISATAIPIRSAKKPTTTTKPRVTKKTLLNPRSVMTDAELQVVLFKRGLPRRTVRESHPQVVARLAAADEDLSTPELDELLRVFFDKGKGNKVAKIKRLQEHDAAQSAAGGDGLKSTDLAFKKGYEGYEGEYAGLLEDEHEGMEEAA
ncbi:hypothetical protein LTR85_003160 [Meristemomyces frigidus]|nr:hypothetical protein LTR85_003160 [Meristemomyces frigidus]